MDDFARLRKNEHRLAVSGAGVIMFGLWSVARAVIYIISMSPTAIAEQLRADEMYNDMDIIISENVLNYSIIGGIIVALIVDLLVRFYIGRSAIIDGRRLRRKSIVYVILAIMLGMGTVSTLTTRFSLSQSSSAAQWGDVMNSISGSIIIDLTAIFVFVELVVSAIIVRRLRKKLGVYATEEV